MITEEQQTLRLIVEAQRAAARHDWDDQGLITRLCRALSRRGTTELWLRRMLEMVAKEDDTDDYFKG